MNIDNNFNINSEMKYEELMDGLEINLLKNLKEDKCKI